MGAPLPSAIYPPGTMAIADIYPTHAGIGGITTQDRALPAFADQVQGQVDRSTGLDSAEGLMGTPAGYLFIAILVLLVAAWAMH